MPKITMSSYEFLKKFPDSETARLFLEQKRWAGNPTCPHCGSVKSYSQTRKKVMGYYACAQCRKVYTVRTGTVFERSHVPLDKWLFAIYLMTTARKGISSLQLSKEIGVRQATAWFMLQRLRHACGNNAGIDFTQKLLSGTVEADETYIGGKESKKHSGKKLRQGCGSIGKTAVLGMRQRGGDVIAKPVPDTSRETIQGEILQSVKSGSTLYTDEHASYTNIPSYQHTAVNHSAKRFVDGMAHANGIESVWAVLKRGY